MIEFFHEWLYVPIYNLLIWLVGVMPNGDGGLAVIVVTLIVKIVTLPFTIAAIKTQKAMKAMEPELKKLKELYEDDKERQAKEMFALYKKYNVKPFASFLALLIQIPVLISLYLVFQQHSLSQVDVPLLYSFVPVPETLSVLFLGFSFLPITGASLVLAILAAATQFAHAMVAIPVPPKNTSSAPASMQEEFGRAMALQARFALPLIIGLVAFSSGAIALYFITSNTFTFLQEIFIARKLRNAPLAVQEVAD